MTTTLLPSPPKVRPNWPRLLTAADLAAMPTSLPDGDVRYELDDGVLIAMAPPGAIHGRQQSKIIKQLNIEAEDKGLGEAYGETGVVLRRRPDRVVAPDAAFVTTDQLPAMLSSEGYLVTIPKLIVEVRSKNDTDTEVASKIAEYFAAGVVEMWVLDHADKTIAVHAPGGTVTRFAAGDVLTSALLPGFAVPVERFFVV